MGRQSTESNASAVAANNNINIIKSPASALFAGAGATRRGSYSSVTASVAVHGSDPSVRQSIWNRYDTFLFDADGVLWTGDTAMPGAPELLKRLMDAGKRVMVVTNNSTKPLDLYMDKFANLGFQGVTPKNFVSSGIVCAHELRKMKLNPKYADRAHLPVYFLGSRGLKEMFEEVDVETIGFGDDRVDKDLPVEELKDFVPDLGEMDDVFAVVCSYDRFLNMDKLTKAANYLVDPDVHFITTNEDLTFPTKPGKITFCAGLISKTLRGATGRTPTVMGKPGRAMWDFVSQRFGGKIDPRRTLMIGDRCDTDILFGKNNRLDTMLVLSGVTKLGELECLEAEGNSELLPTFYGNSVRDLLPQY